MKLPEILKNVLFLAIVYLTLLPIVSAHVENKANRNITVKKINKVVEQGKYKVEFSFYTIGNRGIVDFSFKIKNLDTGIYYNDSMTLQIINPKETMLPAYTPFMDNDSNFNMRSFLSEEGEYKIVVTINTETNRDQFTFPFSMILNDPDNICSWCGMLITNDKTVHSIFLKNGNQKNTCCAHCALDTMNKCRDNLERMETIDFRSNEKIRSKDAMYVMDSTITLEDSMPPYILAFSTRESAKDFQKEYSGTLVNFKNMEEEVNKEHDDSLAEEEINQLLFFEDFLHEIRKNYYIDVDIKKLIDASIKGVMTFLDKDSSLKKKSTAPSLDFIRGFERDETIEDQKIINENIGYVKIKYFGRRTKEDFKKTIDGFKEKGVKGLIIDLQDNPGGNIEEALQIMQYFVPNGSLLVTANINQKEKNYFSNGTEKYEYPVVILINNKTASSAEIFAASLRYYNAILIGQNSYGKNSIQKPIPLNNEYTLFLTIGKYTLPDGTSVNKSGIKPDHYAADDSHRLSMALELIEKSNKRNKANNEPQNKEY